MDEWHIEAELANGKRWVWHRHAPLRDPEKYAAKALANPNPKFQALGVVRLHIRPACTECTILKSGCAACLL